MLDDLLWSFQGTEERRSAVMEQLQTMEVSNGGSESSPAMSDFEAQ